MLRIVLDTETTPQSIRSDTARGPYLRLTPAAVERARAQLDNQSTDALSQHLGFANRMVLWRARRGLYDIRLTHAVDIARTLDMALDEVFEGAGTTDSGTTAGQIDA